MASSPSSRSAMEIELTKLSSPRIFLVRMVVFLVLCALVMVVLYKQIVVAFFANPGLNALIGAVLLIGTILSFRQVIRLYPEVTWVNSFRIANPGWQSSGTRPCWRRWRRYWAESAPAACRFLSKPCGTCWILSPPGSMRRAIFPAT